jgi:FkbM family methyltransferase
MAKNIHKSYSQFSEDLLIKSYLGGDDNINYIDIGCLWPVALSNTYKFYLRGGSGLCIDPNPDIVELYKNMRPRDIFVNAGVSLNTSELTYSMFANPVYNTFDKVRRARVLAKSYKPGCSHIRDINVPVRPLWEIIQELGWLETRQAVDLLCIDVEGYEMDVLRSANIECYVRV